MHRTPTAKTQAATVPHRPGTIELLADPVAGDIHLATQHLGQEQGRRSLGGGLRGSGGAGLGGALILRVDQLALPAHVLDFSHGGSGARSCQARAGARQLPSRFGATS